ncbi:MAG: metallopeptidase family protein [Proteobacteria bacterium]|nr:metallopeptidase family protein [Pseudomonadota bacterium]MDA1357470.1 metallopeptidase family protein [Pseudomonadota bacterium]
MVAGGGTAPALGDIEEIAAKAYETIPEVLRARADDVRICVEEFPSEEIMREMALESPFDLLGLYHGVPFGESSVSDMPHDIDMIFLYRRPLLDYWVESGERLEGVVRHVLIHEIGHHFGFSDADMERIEEAG